MFGLGVPSGYGGASTFNALLVKELPGGSVAVLWSLGGIQTPNDCRQARPLVAVGLLDVVGVERKLCATEGAISSLGSLGRVVEDEESCHPQHVVLDEGPVE